MRINLNVQLIISVIDLGLWVAGFITHDFFLTGTALGSIMNIAFLSMTSKPIDKD